MDDTTRDEPTGLLTKIRSRIPFSIALVLAVLLGAWIGRSSVDDAGEPTEPGVDDHDHDATWTCSMHPQIRMAEAGACPICGMDLVPADGPSDDDAEHAAPPQVTLSPRARALAQLQTATVERTEPRAEVRLLGTVDYDETRLRMITPWTNGRIDRLKLRVTGAQVRKGQVVAQLYSPEVYAGMRDLVVARDQAKKLSRGLHGSGQLAAAAVSAAREKLRLLGVSESEIRAVEKSGKAPKQVAVRSNFAGTVIDRKVEEGDYVEAGTVLFHVADLSRVWVQIDAYASDLPHLALGQSVTVRIDSIPEETFAGTVAFIDPVVDKSTRTARVRVEVPNPDGRLRPGMFAQAVIEGDLGTQASHLVIPASAALFTGRRSVVYVEPPDRPGTYQLREVRLGPRAGPVYPVLAGLAQGERVVSRGAFVVDADLQLRGGRSMMTRPDDRDGELVPAVRITPQVLAEVEPVMTAYLQAQKALADDALPDARRHLEELAAAVNDVQATDHREAWQPVASRLGGHARRAATAEHDGGVREAFEDVSAQVLAILGTFGNPTQQAVQIAYCPMAFDNRGAQWVQVDGTIANPYYGATMLRCGEVRTTLLPTERLPVTQEP